MKTILVLLILFSVIALPALCQTPQSAVETEIAVIKTEIAVIKTEISNLKETVNNGFNNVQKDFDNFQKNFQQNFDSIQKNYQQNFDSIQKNFDRQNNIIIACIGIPLAILAICATVWGILASRRSIRDQTLEKQIEVLTQEIETLKQQRVVNP